MQDTMNYERGGMQVDVEEKHHKGLAFLGILFSAGWIAAYAYWLNYVQEDCCYWTYSVTSPQWGPCNAAPLNIYKTQTNVSAEFRMICVFGVSLFVILLVVAMGHCSKPFRCFSKYLGGLIGISLLGFFIAVNVFRFRDAGRACSNEDQINMNVPIVGVYYTEYYEMGNF